MPLSDLTPEVLVHLYCVERLTQKQIADRYQTHQAKISVLMKKWGVTPLLKSDRVDFPPITEEQHQVLFGSLLGDGTMVATGNHTARFVEGHAEAQSEYTRWKAKMLEPYTSSIYATQKTSADGRIFHGLSFSTHGCRALRVYYDMFYGSGQRVFPPETEYSITPLVLAVWYMDDGSLANRFHPRIAFGLDDVSLKRAVHGLRRLGLRTTLHRDARSDQMVSIEFPGQGDLFFNLVRTHVHPVFGYKLPEETPRRMADANAKKLTTETATKLYRGGMSATDIANMYKVGVTTVRRRLDESKQPRQMGRPRKAYDLRTAGVLLENYTPREWSALDDAEQERWVHEITQILRKSPFPVTPVSEDEVLRQYQQVREVGMALDAGFIRPWSTHGTTACASFFPNRYRASYRGRKTAYELWHDDAALGRAIRFQLQHGDPVLPHRVLRAVTMQSRTPTIFRPTVAKWVYQNYCPPGGSVWDPCAGYGGRLMGAAAAGVRYIGTDVEQETVDGNLHLAEVLGVGDTCHAVLSPAEDFNPPDVDLVFTSPPYFDVEQYSTSEQQSYQRHKTYQEWVGGFLRPVIRTAHNALRLDGHLVLNVADKRGRGGVSLVQTTVDVAVSDGFHFVGQVEMPLPQLNRTVVSEPVLVFQRKE